MDPPNGHTQRPFRSMSLLQISRIYPLQVLHQTLSHQSLDQQCLPAARHSRYASSPPSIWQSSTLRHCAYTPTIVLKVTNTLAILQKILRAWGWVAQAWCPLGPESFELHSLVAYEYRLLELRPLSRKSCQPHAHSMAPRPVGLLVGC